MIGWTREGDADYPGSGLATVITICGGGAMWLDVGKTHANGQYRDALGNMDGTTVDINADGWGEFPVSGGSLSVWIPVSSDTGPTNACTADRWVFSNARKYDYAIDLSGRDGTRRFTIDFKPCPPTSF